MPNDNLWFQRDQPIPEPVSKTTEPTEPYKVTLPEAIKLLVLIPWALIEGFIWPRRIPPNTSSNPTLRRP